MITVIERPTILEIINAPEGASVSNLSGFAYERGHLVKKNGVLKGEFCKKYYDSNNMEYWETLYFYIDISRPIADIWRDLPFDMRSNVSPFTEDFLRDLNECVNGEQPVQLYYTS
jgi:hypothetical protein